jgi:hypothetical protein
MIKLKSSSVFSIAPRHRPEIRHEARAKHNLFVRHAVIKFDGTGGFTAEKRPGQGNKFTAMETAMTAHLKLVSQNAMATSHGRLDGLALHRLADRLTKEIKSGHSEMAHALASLQNLSPFAIAIIATWMTRAGLSERDILKAVA